MDGLVRLKLKQGGPNWGAGQRNQERREGNGSQKPVVVWQFALCTHCNAAAIPTEDGKCLLYP
jgi:hypothetical protein